MSRGAGEHNGSQSKRQITQDAGMQHQQRAARAARCPRDTAERPSICVASGKTAAGPWTEVVRKGAARPQQKRQERQKGTVQTVQAPVARPLQPTAASIAPLLQTLNVTAVRPIRRLRNGELGTGVHRINDAKNPEQWEVEAHPLHHKRVLLTGFKWNQACNEAATALSQWGQVERVT